MDTTSVRRLSHDTAGVLALVADGRTVEITNNGRPVARIVPVVPDPLAELIAQGRLIPAEPGAVRPARRTIEGPPLSETIDELRADRL